MKKHILITYSSECAENGHIDPDFTNLVYGDSGQNGYILMNNLTEGSYIFFNTRIGGCRYITSYFYVEKILLNNRDKNEIDALKSDAKNDEVIIVGSRTHSKILTAPLLLDKNLAVNILSLKADEDYFNNAAVKKKTELSAINSKTRTPRILQDNDKEILLGMCKYRG